MSSFFPSKPFGTSGFGSGGTSTGIMFGANQSSSATTTSATSSIFSFGSTASTAQTNKPFVNLFGQPTSTTGGSTLFGGGSNTTSSFSFGGSAQSGTSSLFGSSNLQTTTAPSTSLLGGFGTSPTAAVSPSSLSSLLYMTSKDKDPDVAKRSAQMLLRAQCYSYSTDPIFHNFQPKSDQGASDSGGGELKNKSFPSSSKIIKELQPEPISQRVLSLLPNSTSSIHRTLGLYSGKSVHNENTSNNHDYKSKSMDLRRLVLSPRLSTDDKTSSSKSSTSNFDLLNTTLEDYLKNKAYNDESEGESVSVNPRGYITDNHLYSNINNNNSLQMKTEPNDETIRSPVNCSDCVKLTRSGYHTYPALNKLQLDPITNSCVVSDFSVYREGYGCIAWPGQTDVAGIDLDSIVFIRRKEVIVYPDDEDKPPVGEGLNKIAEITLHSVYPVNKTTRLPITDENQLNSMNYNCYLEEATTRMGAEFLDYLPATGSWSFKVQHFTRYGLDANESLIDVSDLHPDIMKILQNKSQTEGNDDNIRTNSKFRPNAHSTVLTDIHNDPQCKRLSLLAPTQNSDGNNDVVEKKRRSFFDYQKSATGILLSADNDSKCNDITMDESYTAINNIYLGDSYDKSRHSKSDFQFIPIRIPWQMSLLNTDRNLCLDRAFFMSRSFRVQLHGANNLHFYSPSDKNLNVIKAYEMTSLPCCGSIVNAILKVQFEHSCFDRNDSNSPFPKVQITQSNDFLQTVRSCLPSIDNTHTASLLNECVNLLCILFIDEGNEADRKRALTYWLKSSLLKKSTLWNDTSSSNNADNVYGQILEDMFKLDRKSAVSKSLASGNYRLAQRIAIPPGLATVQNSMKDQIVHWCDREADQHIDQTLMKIYMLLSGELLMELSDGTNISLIADKHWRQNLLVILRYCLLSELPCDKGINLLDHLIRNELCFAEEDIVLSLLKFYVDPATFNLSELLQTKELFNSNDFTVSWCLLQSIDSLKVKRMNPLLYDRVCMEFARQLEESSFLKWSSFVLSHICNSRMRSKLCLEFLCRHASADIQFSDNETWYEKELGWKCENIYFAKSVIARYLHEWASCCHHLIKAKQPSAALSVLFDKLLPASFEQDDQSDLVQMLELFQSYVNTNGPVEGWMESGRFLLNFFNAKAVFASDRIDSDEQTIKLAQAISNQYKMLIAHLSDIVNEGRISLPILRVICSGIRSSICLMCQWLSKGTIIDHSESLEQALVVFDRRDSICNTIDLVC